MGYQRSLCLPSDCMSFVFRLAASLHEPRRLGRFVSQDLSNAAWALSRLGWQPSDQACVDAHAVALLNAAQTELKAASAAAAAAAFAAAAGRTAAVGGSSKAAARSLPSYLAAYVANGQQGGTSFPSSAQNVVASPSEAAAKAASHVVATLIALDAAGGAWPSPAVAQQLLRLLQALVPYAPPESLSGAAVVMLLAAKAEQRHRAWPVPAPTSLAREVRASDWGLALTGRAVLPG